MTIMMLIVDAFESADSALCATLIGLTNEIGLSLQDGPKKLANEGLLQLHQILTYII